MRKQRLIAIISAAALLLSGCSSLSLSGPDILTPPRAAGNRAQLQSLIEKDAGGSYTLITPLSGEYKSGIVSHDFDGDGEEDAIALYTAADGSAKALVAAEKGGSYSSLGSCTLSSSNISSVGFADIDSDGVEELFIACDTGSPVSALSVCFIGSEVTKTDVAEGFSGFVTGDFDGDSAADVLVFMPANVKATAQAILMVFSQDGFIEKSSCETDPAIEAYARLTYGKVSDRIYGAAADGVNENGEYSTQLLYFDSATESLINPLFVYAGYDNTLRSEKIFACDWNGDGVIEIPACELMKHSKDEDASKVCTSVKWRRYDPEQLTPLPVSEAVLCGAMGFITELGENASDKYTARCADKTAMTVYELADSEKSVLGQELLTIKYYDKGGFDSESSSETVIYESDTGVYTCIAGGGSDLSADTIKNSFRLLSEI